MNEYVEKRSQMLGGEWIWQGVRKPRAGAFLTGNVIAKKGEFAS